jgi:hypothetical protein
MSGGFDSEDWYTDPTTQFVCAKTACYDEDLDETDYFEDCCYGHYEYDQMFNGFTGSRSDYYGLTNHDSLTSTDPRTTSYSVNYIFDDFSYDHCEDSGYDVDSLLLTQYNEYIANLDSQGKPKGPRKVSTSQIKSKEKMQAVVDKNRQRVEFSIARKAAKKTQEEKAAKKAAKEAEERKHNKKSSSKTTSDKTTESKTEDTKKVRKVIPGSPSLKGNKQ